MEETSQTPAESTEETSGASETAKNSVSHESHLKLLREKKALQAKFQEVEARYAALEREKLEAQGNKEEAYNSLKKQFETVKSQLDNTNAKYAWNAVSSKVKQAAIAKGCKDADKFLKLLGDDDLRSIEIDENFNIQEDVLNNLIEKGSKENYFLFESSKKISATGTPGKASPAGSGKSESEIFESYIKSLK